MPNFEWSNSTWSNMGRPAGSGLTTNTPAVGRNADGRLEIFARAGDSRLYHKWQKEPNGGWTDWYAFDPPVTILGPPAVQRNVDGRLEVFFAGPNNELYHTWQLAPNGSWSGAFGMGRSVQGLPAVQVNADGRLEVFVWDMGNQLCHLWQNPGSGAGWNQQWRVINFSRGDIVAGGTPAAGRNQDLRLEVFVRGSDGNLWHAWQPRVNSTAEPDISQMILYPMDGNPSITGNPAVKNGAGNLEVLWVDANGQLMHVYQTRPNNGWNGRAVSLGGNVQNRPAIGRAADGRLEVFVRGLDNRIYQSTQLTPASSSWSPLTSLGGNYPSAPAVETNADGRMDTFLVNGTGELWQLKQFPKDFVGVMNGNFALNGRKFRHVGVNTHELVYHKPDEARNDLTKAQSAGIKHVRIFLSSSKHETSGVGGVIERLQRVLNEAYSRGIRLTVAMTNEYNYPNLAADSLGGINCVKGDNGSYTVPYSDTYLLNHQWVAGGFRARYLQFVREVVQYFKDSPAVFAWEVGNEISDPSYQDDGCETILNFYREVAATIKSIDRYHLVAPGNISTTQLGFDSDPNSAEAKRERLYGDPNFDYITCHVYEKFDEHPRPVVDRELARRLIKPFVVEEYGYRMSQDRTGKNETGFFPSVRQFFEDLYNPAVAQGGSPKPADSVMVWGVEFPPDNASVPGHFHGSGDNQCSPIAQNLLTDYIQLWRDWDARLNADNSMIPR